MLFLVKSQGKTPLRNAEFHPGRPQGTMSRRLQSLWQKLRGGRGGSDSGFGTGRCDCVLRQSRGPPSHLGKIEKGLLSFLLTEPRKPEGHLEDRGERFRKF